MGWHCVVTCSGKCTLEHPDWESEPVKVEQLDETTGIVKGGFFINGKCKLKPETCNNYKSERELAHESEWLLKTKTYNNTTTAKKEKTPKKIKPVQTEWKF